MCKKNKKQTTAYCSAGKKASKWLDFWAKNMILFVRLDDLRYRLKWLFILNLTICSQLLQCRWISTNGILLGWRIRSSDVAHITTIACFVHKKNAVFLSPSIGVIPANGGKNNTHKTLKKQPALKRFAKKQNTRAISFSWFGNWLLWACNGLRRSWGRGSWEAKKIKIKAFVRNVGKVLWSATPAPRAFLFELYSHRGYSRFPKNTLDFSCRCIRYIFECSADFQGTPYREWKCKNIRSYPVFLHIYPPNNHVERLTTFNWTPID